MSTSVDDNKSIMMYNINEIENNDSNEEILINSQEMDSPEDEFESSKDNTMEDIDQYDSDETFESIFIGLLPALCLSCSVA